MSRNLSDKRMDSEELARIRQRLDAAVISDLRIDGNRMWHEIDALRFELAAANERTAIARQERDDIAGRYWALQMTAVKGGKV